MESQHCVQRNTSSFQREKRLFRDLTEDHVAEDVSDLGKNALDDSNSFLVL
jgi:hypothetical protein